MQKISNLMLIKKGQGIILALASLLILFFAFFYISRKNYEFVLYVGVIIFFFIVILFSNKKLNYSNTSLWGLVLWAFLHMAGGSVQVNGVRLYELILIPISSTYNIFRYDQFVHIIGFGIATLVLYEVLKPLLKLPIKRKWAFSIIILMAGLGVGALNEIVEFTATIIVPQTGVGGFINTMLDLVSDLIGAILALFFILIKHPKKL